MTWQRTLAVLLITLSMAGCGGTSSPALQIANPLTHEQRLARGLPPEQTLTLASKADIGRADEVPDAVLKCLADTLPKQLKWKVVAYQPRGDDALLWVAFTDIADGGIDLIYSSSEKKIVGEFMGGYGG